MKDEEYKLNNYKILKHIIELVYQKFPKSASIKLFLGYICHIQLDLKWIAVYELEKLSQCYSNMKANFSSQMFLMSIQSDMIEQELRKKEKTGIDVESMMEFQALYKGLFDSMSDSVTLHEEFWVELKEEKPIIKKLQNLGSKITFNLDECRKNYKKIMSKSSSHLKTLILFGHFVKNILNDIEESRKILGKAAYIHESTNFNNQYVEDSRAKYGENSQFSILIASGDQKSLGDLKSINSQFIMDYEYSKEELKGKKIDYFLPKIFAEWHHFFMSRYFNENKPTSLNIERDVFPANKRGFIVRSSLLIKVLPQINMGIDIVGLVIKNDAKLVKDIRGVSARSNTILFCAKTGIIYGVSEGCYYNFGIFPDLLYGNSKNAQILSIQTIFNKFFDLGEIRKFCGSGSFETILDTSEIPKNYYLDRNELKELGMPIEGKKAFKKYKVSAEVSSIQTYQTEKLAIAVMDFFDLENIENAHVPSPNKGLRFIEKLEEEIKNEEIRKRKEEEEIALQAQILEEMQQRSMHSKIQQGKSLIDQERKLKEKKLMLSKKRVPNSIKFLKFSIVLGFVLLGLNAATETLVKWDYSRIMITNFEGVESTGKMMAIIAEISLQTRLIVLNTK